MSNIKRAVSLYSLQDKYARGTMSMEQLFSFLKEIDVTGLEFISDQMMHNTPTPSDDEILNFRRLTDKYGLEPVCNDIFINTKLYKNRTLTRKESTKLLLSEIQLAHRLGFKLVRLVSMTPPDIIEPALSEAERLDVTLALEVHAGMSFSHPMTQAFIDEMKRLGSNHVGLVVDTGIFCRRHPRISTNFFLGLGLNPQIAEYIDAIFARGTDPRRAFEEELCGKPHGMFPKALAEMIHSDVDRDYAIFSPGYENSELSILDEYLPYVKHFHGKFFEMTEEGFEYSIDYPSIVAYLKQKGYNGYISSEYEGQRFTLFDQPIHDLEQVRRHQQMLKQCIEE